MSSLDQLNPQDRLLAEYTLRFGPIPETTWHVIGRSISAYEAAVQKAEEALRTGKPVPEWERTKEQIAEWEKNGVIFRP